jgi:hypothetical protein
MVLPLKFSVSEDNDYEHLAAASGRLRALLEAFSDGSLPPEYGDNKLVIFARSLLDAQMDDGSFSVSKNPEALPADVRDDAHRFVTWSAAAFLCLFDEKRKEASRAVEGLDTGMLRALRAPAAGDFTFPESGPAELVQQVEAVMILASGGVPARLRRSPETAPVMADGLKLLAADFRRRLDSGDTMLPGGFDYQQLFLQALSALEY